MMSGSINFTVLFQIEDGPACIIFGFANLTKWQARCQPPRQYLFLTFSWNFVVRFLVKSAGIFLNMLVGLLFDSLALMMKINRI